MTSRFDSSTTVDRNAAAPAVGVLLLLLSFLAGCSADAAQDSAGSTTAPPFRAFRSDEIPLPEAGSTVIGRDGLPEADSAVIGSGRWPEAGSAIGGNAIAGSVVQPDSEEYRVGTRSPQHKDRTGVRLRDVARITIGSLVAIVLIAAAYCLFRIGSRRPHDSNLWSRRMNLASEIAQQMDLFLVAAYREEWDICRSTLAALNDMNGQRTILLCDESNWQVLQFIAAAIDCRVNRDVADYLPQLRTIQVHALAALRKEIGRSDELSETLMKALRDTRHLYRSLRDLPPDEKS